MSTTKKSIHLKWMLLKLKCREEGIRTLDTVTRIQTFQACSFDHSDTSLIRIAKIDLFITKPKFYSSKVTSPRKFFAKLSAKEPS